MNVLRISSAILRRLNIPLLQSDDWNLLYQLRRSLRSVPRYESGSLKFGEWDIEYVDAASFISAFDNVVVQRTNDFVTASDAPFILDCGANIGVSVIHYKKLFPNAKVIAFEPDQQVCRALRRNLKMNNITDVEVIEAAVWTANGETDFFSEGADAGRVDCDTNSTEDLIEGSEKGRRVKVRTVDFRDYLRAPVDFIKLDIEGAESEVLASCAEYLPNVKSMVVEFHVATSKPYQLGIAMNALAEAKFNVSISSYGNQITLTNREGIIRNAVEFDQYLLLHAWR